MDSFVGNIPSCSIIQQTEPMNESFSNSDPSSKSKLIVIAQCSPHIRDVLKVQQTLEKVNSYWRERHHNLPIERMILHKQLPALSSTDSHFKEPSAEPDHTVEDTELKRIRKERDLAVEQRQVLADGLKFLKLVLHELKSSSEGLLTSDDARQLIKELEDQVTSDIISQVKKLWNEWEIRVSTVEHQKQQQEHLLSQMFQMGEDIEKIRNQSGELDVMIGEKDEEMLELQEQLDEHRYMVEQLNNELEVYANELEDRDETIFRLTEKLSGYDQSHYTQSSTINDAQCPEDGVTEPRNECQDHRMKEEQETSPNQDVGDVDKNQKSELDGLRETLAERDIRLEHLLKDLSERDEMIAKMTAQIELRVEEQEMSLEKASKGTSESVLIHELEAKHEEDLKMLRKDFAKEMELLHDRLKAEYDEQMLKRLELCEALEREKQNLQSQLEASTKELQDAKKEEVKNHVVDKQDQAVQGTTQEQSHEVDDEKDVLIVTLEKQVEEYQTKLANKEEEMERLMISFQEKEQAVNDLDEANKQLKIKVDNKQRDEEDMQRELVEQTTILAEREAENEELREGVDKYQARVRDLVRMQEEFEELQDAMQSEIERLQHENITLSRRLSQLSSPKDRQQFQAANSEGKNTKKFLTHIKKLIIIVEKSKAINAQLEYSLAMKSEECEKLREELYTERSRRTTPRNLSRPKTPMKDLDQEILALKAAIQQVKSMTPRGMSHRTREKQ